MERRVPFRATSSNFVEIVAEVANALLGGGYSWSQILHNAMSWSGQHDTLHLKLLFFASVGKSGYSGFELVGSKLLSSNYTIPNAAMDIAESVSPQDSHRS